MLQPHQDPRWGIIDMHMCKQHMKPTTTTHGPAHRAVEELLMLLPTASTQACTAPEEFSFCSPPGRRKKANNKSTIYAVGSLILYCNTSPLIECSQRSCC